MILRLGAESRLTPGFQVLSQAEYERIRELAAGAGNILIAPALISTQPVFEVLRTLDCRIELVDPAKEAAVSEIEDRIPE